MSPPVVQQGLGLGGAIFDRVTLPLECIFGHIPFSRFRGGVGRCYGEIQRDAARYSWRYS